MRGSDFACALESAANCRRKAARSAILGRIMHAVSGKGCAVEVICRSGQHFQVQISAGHHELMADEPLDIGEDAGPTPYDFLLSALGACTVMTLEMYAQRKLWPLTGVEIRLSTYKVYARDCEDCSSEAGARVDIIERQITLEGDLSIEQRARLLEIADKCPVHRTLTSEVKIRTTLGADTVSAS